MSDENRNEAGEFTVPPEQLFGREEELVRNGYTVRKDDAPAEQETYGSDDASLRQAAEDLAAKRGEADVELTPSELIAHRDPDPLEAVTVAQAAQERSMASSEIKTFTEGMDLAKFAEEIDAKRAEVIKGDPEVAKALGVEDPAKSKAEQAEDAEIDAMDGLDAETRKALKIPQVRQAIEQEFSQAEQVRQQYTGSLQAGQEMLQATVSALAPQLEGMPLEHWPQAIQMLAQVDPVRAGLVADTLNKWGALQQASQQERHRQAQAQQQQFEQNVRLEDERLVEMIGGANAAEEANQAMITYLAGHGVPKNQMVNVVAQNPVLQTAEARQTIWKAQKYDELMKAPKAVATKPLPPVSRPGTSGAARSTGHAGKLADLQGQLAGAKGDKALRIAAQISKLRRSA